MKKELWVAGGCFWGTQRYLSLLNGVLATDVGYANGRGNAPSYEEVCTGTPGFAEAVHIVYDSEVLPLEKLLYYFFLSIDPVAKNRQGNDVGVQYRTGIYYQDPADAEVIKTALQELQARYDKPIAIESGQLENYFEAEEYHQDYLEKSPGGYCHISPSLFQLAKETQKYVKPSQETLAKKLTPLQYQVTQQGATEPPFKNEYDSEERQGIYVDVATGQPLFSSQDKFQSGCGWPAFSKPLNSAGVEYLPDSGHGMQRVEVKSTLGGSHLGHVFNDGPKDEGGLRYCINSASLRFIPKEEMEKEGYGSYLFMVK